MRRRAAERVRERRPRIGFAGDPRVLEEALLPAFARTTAELRYVVGANARVAIRLGRRFRLPEATTQYERLLDDPELDAIVLARAAVSDLRDALAAGKRVLSDPLPPDAGDECDSMITEALAAGTLIAGFHRRHAPLYVQTRELLAASTDRRTMEWVVRGDADDHAAHAVDLFAYLGSSTIAGVEWRPGEIVRVLLADGSSGLARRANATDAGFLRERLTVRYGELAIEATDFRHLSTRDKSKGHRHGRRQADDGYAGMAARFVAILERSNRNRPSHDVTTPPSAPAETRSPNPGERAS